MYLHVRTVFYVGMMYTHTFIYICNYIHINICMYLHVCTVLYVGMMYSYNWTNKRTIIYTYAKDL